MKVELNRHHRTLLAGLLADHIRRVRETRALIPWDTFSEADQKNIREACELADRDLRDLYYDTLGGMQRDL